MMEIGKMINMMDLELYLIMGKNIQEISKMENFMGKGLSIKPMGKF